MLRWSLQWKIFISNQHRWKEEGACRIQQREALIRNADTTTNLVNLVGNSGANICHWDFSMWHRVVTWRPPDEYLEKWLASLILLPGSVNTYGLPWQRWDCRWGDSAVWAHPEGAESRNLPADGAPYTGQPSCVYETVPGWENKQL